jgi:hypothetical protein
MTKRLAIAAFWMIAAGLGPAAARGATVHQPTLHDVVAGAVHWDASGHDELATFIPNLGFSLADAAALGGYDHFDWVQVALVYPGAIAPFLDPPLGGKLLQPADFLPYYWDEQSSPLLDPQYQLSANSTENSLQFFDEPSNFFVRPGVNYMEFITTLAAVSANGLSWKPLGSHVWKSDFNPAPIFLERNITPVAGGVGGTFGGEDLGEGVAPSSEVAALWRANGGDVSIPEPQTWTLMIGGLFFVGVAIRRNWARAGRHGPAT